MTMDRKNRGWTFTVAVSLGLALVAVGCKSSTDPGTASSSTVPGGKGTIAADFTKDADAGEAKSGGKIVYGLNAESDGFAPANSRWASSTYIVGFSVMDPLAAYDKDLKPQPYLAKAITSNADFTVWTIKLREGVTLHNAKPVDAALVAANLVGQQNASLTGPAMAFVEKGGITVADPLTVTVKMSKPWSTFPHTLTAQVGAIVAQETLDDKENGARKPIGSGPFIFDQWVTGSKLDVKKNINYWRKGFPLLDNIEFKPLADIGSRGKSLDSGAVNIFETNDPTQILDYTDRASKGEGVQIFTDKSGEGAKIFIALNVSKEPFDDPIARQAVAYSGDVVALSNTAYEGVFPPAYGPFSESSFFYVKPPDYPQHDLVKAKALAAEYQTKHGKPLAFTANIIPELGVQNVAQVLQSQAAEAGITVTLKTEEQLSLIIDALSGNFEATGFILFGSPHLDREYVFIASPPQKAPGVSLNLTRMGLDGNGNPNGDNDKLVAAMDAARKTDDPAKQKEQYGIVQAEMAKNLNMLFLVRQTSAVVFGPELHGAKTWTLPDEKGGKGAIGAETVQTMTFNLWLGK